MRDWNIGPELASVLLVPGVSPPVWKYRFFGECRSRSRESLHQQIHLRRRDQSGGRSGWLLSVGAAALRLPANQRRAPFAEPLGTGCSTAIGKLRCISKAIRSHPTSTNLQIIQRRQIHRDAGVPVVGVQGLPSATISDVLRLGVPGGRFTRGTQPYTSRHENKFPSMCELQ